MYYLGVASLQQDFMGFASFTIKRTTHCGVSELATRCTFEMPNAYSLSNPISSVLRTQTHAHTNYSLCDGTKVVLYLDYMGIL
jgi:hypothetical protein